MNFQSKALLPAVLALLALAAASTLTVSVAQEAANTSGVPAIVDKSAAGELAFWNSIKNSSNPDDFKTYIVNFPNGMFQDPALQRFEAAGGNRGDLTNIAAVQVEETASAKKAEPEKPVVSRSVTKSKPAAKAKAKSKKAKTVTTKKKSKKASVRKSASKKTCKGSSKNCGVVAKNKLKKKKQLAPNPTGGGGGGGGSGGGGSSGGDSGGGGGGWGN